MLKREKDDFALQDTSPNLLPPNLFSSKGSSWNLRPSKVVLLRFSVLMRYAEQLSFAPTSLLLRVSMPLRRSGYLTAQHATLRVQQL